MRVYKTGGWKELIEEIEATRVNEKSVWIYNELRNKEERSARYSNYSNYWVTIEEAKNYLKEKLHNQIKRAEKQISKAKNQLKILDKY